MPGRHETPTPIAADSVLPRMMARGVARGLDGTAKASTADAPIGATIEDAAAGAMAAPARQERVIPIRLPPAARKEGVFVICSCDGLS
ncbi:hypothetical protein GCM10023158_22470 [Gluconacetobacter tumulicola]